MQCVKTQGLGICQDRYLRCGKSKQVELGRMSRIDNHSLVFDNDNTINIDCL